MKKVFALLLSLTFIVVLAACGRDEEVNRHPRLYGVIENVSVEVGDEYDPLEGVSAFDPEDGDITDDITVAGTYGTASAGNYTFTIRVTDSGGLTDSKQVNLTVIDPDSLLLPPRIMAPESRTITTTTSFDVWDLGVTAYDRNADVDITSDLEVDMGTFDQTVAAEYSVTFSVTDSEGLTSTRTVTITVIEYSGNNPRKADLDTLVVGSSDFSGQFIPWGGSSSYDIAVRNLYMGLGVIAQTRYGQHIINPQVVVDYSIDTVMDGDDIATRTYTYEIQQDMLWSDGEPITAHDYVFGIKLFSSYLKADAGSAAVTSGNQLVGYQAWRQGCYGEMGTDGWECDDTHDYDAEPLDFEGVKLIDDYTFSLTIDGSNLPYFYELIMVAAGPQPKHVYTMDGAYDFLTKDEVDAIADETLDLGLPHDHMGYHVRQYMEAPPVSSGPYIFDRYVRGQFVQMYLNPNFYGNFEGEVAEIQNIIIKVVPMETDLEHLLTGDIDILPGLVQGEKIRRALNAGYLYPDTFLRLGFGALFFHTDFAPLDDYRVRQAIAYAIDREDFVDSFLEGFGVLVDGPYGLGQWMYQDSDVVPDDLITYTYDPIKGNEVLDETEWVFESDGSTPFDPTLATAASNYFRHNAAGERLTLKWFGSIGEYTDLLNPVFSAGADVIGMEIIVTTGDFGLLLEHFYLEADPREYHMFNLAWGFSAVYDPYWSFHSDNIPTFYNNLRLTDSPTDPGMPIEASVTYTHGDFTYTGPELTVDELTVLMRYLPGTDTDTFQVYWDMLMVRLNKLLPMLPLYSNEYYHFANIVVQNFSTTGFWQWHDQIVYMSLEDPGAE